MLREAFRFETVGDSSLPLRSTLVAGEDLLEVCLDDNRDAGVFNVVTVVATDAARLGCLRGVRLTMTYTLDDADGTRAVRGQMLGGGEQKESAST